MEDDKFPTFFFGVMSAILLVTVALPLTWGTLCHLSHKLAPFLPSLFETTERDKKVSGTPWKPQLSKKNASASFSPSSRSPSVDTQKKVEKTNFSESPNPNSTCENAISPSFLSSLRSPFTPFYGNLHFWLSHPSHLYAHYRILRTHPALLRKIVFPRVSSFCFRPKVFLLFLWVLSVYLFATQIPKAASFEVLGLNPATASIGEIKNAYRSLSFRYHPDKDPSPEARERYGKIRKAFKRLTGAKLAEDGTPVEDTEEPLGVGFALPFFLRDPEHEGRTLVILLLCAFGIPAVLLYFFFIREKTTYGVVYERLKQMVTLARGLHGEMGMPENPKVAATKLHQENIQKLLKQAGLWQSGMVPEVVHNLPDLARLHKLCSHAKNATGRMQQDALFRLQSLGFEDDALQSLIQTILSEEWEKPCAAAKPLENIAAEISRNPPDYFPVSEEQFEAANYFLGFVMELMPPVVKPFDLQNRSTRLLKLYRDKESLLHKCHQWAQKMEKDKREREKNEKGEKGCEEERSMLSQEAKSRENEKTQSEFSSKSSLGVDPTLSSDSLGANSCDKLKVTSSSYLEVNSETHPQTGKLFSPREGSALQESNPLHSTSHTSLSSVTTSSLPSEQNRMSSKTSSSHTFDTIRPAGSQSAPSPALRPPRPHAAETHENLHESKTLQNENSPPCLPPFANPKISSHPSNPTLSPPLSLSLHKTIQNGENKKSNLFYETQERERKEITVSKSLSPQWVEKLLALDEEIMTMHNDMNRSAIEYLSSGHHRRMKKFQKYKEAERRKLAPGGR